MPVLGRSRAIPLLILVVLLSLVLGGCRSIMADGCDPGRDVVQKIDSKNITTREQVTQAIGAGHCENETERGVYMVYPYRTILAKRSPMFDLPALELAPMLLLCPPWGPPTALFALVAEPVIAVGDFAHRINNARDAQLCVQYDRSGTICGASVRYDALTRHTMAQPPPAHTALSSAP